MATHKTHKAKQKLFVEASAIVEPRPSGIGHSIVATIRALCELEGFTDRYRIILLVPRGAKHNLDRWNFPADKFEVRAVVLEKHILQILLKYKLLPPMDLLQGRGIYLFPNYKNWPLLFSKSLTYIYDASFELFPETIHPKNLVMLKRNIQRWIKRTNFVITISQASRSEIIDHLHCPPQKIGVVYCGVDPQLYRPYAADQIRKLKKQQRISGDYILFVGNVEPRKNLQRLLEAYRDLPAKLTERYALVLVGAEGWLNDATMRSIADLQAAGYTIIRPASYLADDTLAVLYSGASLVVHPAIHEGFGLPPLQAMASGVPVAVSDIGALQEIVADGGYYFNPQDTGSIKRTIQRLLEKPDLGQKLISTARDRSKQFSWSSTAVQLAQYIERFA